MTAQSLMNKFSWYYKRPDLALKYLRIVYQGAINRIALLDVRRTGKTSFLLNDFYGVAIENGFVPVYANLWAEPDNPAKAILSAVSKTLQALQSDPASTLSNIAKSEVKKVEVGNTLLGKLAVEFDHKKIEAPSGSDLTQINVLLAELAAQCDDKAILIHR